MEIRLLDKEYIYTEQFYQDFLNNKIKDKDEYFTNEYIYVDQAPCFPIYLNIGDEQVRKASFQEAFEVIGEYYLDIDRDIHMDGMFWYTLFCTEHRGYILEHYPEIKDGIGTFRNIVLKPFDWENYVYKCLLGAQYIQDGIKDVDERREYYMLIVDNLDVYNYIIKADIFRNNKFLLNILEIIKDHEGLSNLLKRKIKGRPDLGKDERYGRRVIFEFNKSYPIIMSPMLEKKQLEKLFFEYLGYYYDATDFTKSVEGYKGDFREAL